MKKTVKERIKEFLELEGISQSKFESKCGLSNGYLNKLKRSPGADKIQKILGAYPELSYEWLVDGKGELMSKEGNEGIPLLPVNAVGGYLSGVSSQIMEKDCDYYVMPIFNGADFLIRIEGDSMMPDYMPGDIVACWKLTDTTFFEWGRVYVVDTKHGALIKKIEPSEHEDCINLCSINERYKPISMHSSDINGIAVVKGVLKVV